MRESEMEVIRTGDRAILDSWENCVIIYGDGVGMYKTHLFGSPSIIGCSPAFNKFVMQNDDLFSFRRSTPDIVGQKSLVVLNGKAHTRPRSYVFNSINKPDALQKIAKLVQPRIVASFRSWVEKGKIRGIEETRKVVEETIRMANIAAFTFRLVSQDIEYKGHMPPKCWKVLVWLRCMHNDRNNFDNQCVLTQTDGMYGYVTPDDVHILLD
ncbi:hypothetical protein GIB67_028886 [Kingdonia uniflora]|uniref:Cytochrome P450 n=1 Tax=Kingdonia uniflora TaxID=39325 RepID=A0A7J7LT97_9MAGN|nr:hypothetical protein GIB67_028886 [Kingdonia uniflora]